MIFLKLMPAYGYFPLWNNLEETRNIDPKSMLISDALCNDLYVWAEQFDNNLNIEDPALSGFKSLEEEIAFTKEGEKLKKRLEIELGESYRITFEEYPIGFHTKNIMKYIKLMPDYYCFPLWYDDKDISGNIDPFSLPISPPLQEGLDDWRVEFDAILNIDDPASSAFSSDESFELFKKKGKQIHKKLQLELGNKYQIIYFYDSER